MKQRTGIVRKYLNVSSLYSNQDNQIELCFHSSMKAGHKKVGVMFLDGIIAHGSFSKKDMLIFV